MTHIMPHDEAKTAAALLAPRLADMTHRNDHGNAILAVADYFAPLYAPIFRDFHTKAERQLHVTSVQADASYRLPLEMWNDIERDYGIEIKRTLRAAL